MTPLALCLLLAWSAAASAAAPPGTPADARERLRQALLEDTAAADPPQAVDEDGALRALARRVRSAQLGRSPSDAGGNAIRREVEDLLRELGAPRREDVIERYALRVRLNDAELARLKAQETALRERLASGGVSPEDAAKVRRRLADLRQRLGPLRAGALDEAAVPTAVAAVPGAAARAADAGELIRLYKQAPPPGYSTVRSAIVPAPDETAEQRRLREAADRGCMLGAASAPECARATDAYAWARAQHNAAWCADHPGSCAWKACGAIGPCGTVDEARDVARDGLTWSNGSRLALSAALDVAGMVPLVGWGVKSLKGAATAGKAAKAAALAAEKAERAAAVRAAGGIPYEDLELFKSGSQGAVLQVRGQPNRLIKVYDNVPGVTREHLLEQKAVHDELIREGWPVVAVDVTKVGDKGWGLAMARVDGDRMINVLNRLRHEDPAKYETLKTQADRFLRRVDEVTERRHGRGLADRRQGSHGEGDDYENFIVQRRADGTLVPVNIDPFNMGRYARGN